MNSASNIILPPLSFDVCSHQVSQLILLAFLINFMLMSTHVLMMIFHSRKTRYSLLKYHQLLFFLSYTK